MLKYWLFIVLFVAALILFFVGLFANIVPFILVGAILLFALFLTRQRFMRV